MMSPEQKGEELINTFQFLVNDFDDERFNPDSNLAKKCALVSVNLLYNQVKHVKKFATDETHEKSILFWKEVKDYIENKYYNQI